MLALMHHSCIALFEFVQHIKKKLLKIGNEFYDKFGDVNGKTPIVDIQLTGSLANYNYTDFSDLDLHVLVDFSKIDAPNKILKAAVDGIRFVWNTRHDIKMRGYDVEVYLQDAKEPQLSWFRHVSCVNWESPSELKQD
jgi:predicted nucleotidyltransferase